LLYPFCREGRFFAIIASRWANAGWTAVGAVADATSKRHKILVCGGRGMKREAVETLRKEFGTVKRQRAREDAKHD
jgi:hypothetical protein